jgi:predicted DNA-binding transcriptional regulator AlpA
MSLPHLLSQVAELTPEELPAVLAAVAARMAAVQQEPRHEPTVDGDVNLPIAEAARRLSISRDWLYRHADKLPFTVRLGRRVTFSAAGLEEWRRKRMRRT